MNPNDEEDTSMTDADYLLRCMKLYDVITNEIKGMEECLQMLRKVKQECEEAFLSIQEEANPSVLPDVEETEGQVDGQDGSVAASGH